MGVSGPMKAYRVIKNGARIDGVPYGTPSIIRLKETIARHHLARGNIKPYVGNKLKAKIRSKKKYQIKDNYGVVWKKGLSKTRADKLKTKLKGGKKR